MQRMLYTVPQALEVAPIGRTTLYEQIKQGTIHPVKLGRRTFIAHDELNRFVASLGTSEG